MPPIDDGDFIPQTCGVSGWCSGVGGGACGTGERREAKGALPEPVGSIIGAACVGIGRRQKKKPRTAGRGGEGGGPGRKKRERREECQRKASAVRDRRRRLSIMRTFISKSQIDCSVKFA